MRSTITFNPTGIIIDLANDEDYGHPNAPAIIAEYLGNTTLATTPFTCMHGMPVYLRRVPIFVGSKDRRVWAVHFSNDSACHAPDRPGMSDDHRRKAECWVAAGEVAGWRADTEVVLPGGTTRPDVVIYGPKTVAVEVQRSYLTREAAVSRTRRSVARGVDQVAWFGNVASPWFFRVPSVACNPQIEWDHTPDPHEVAITSGLSIIRAERCFGKCPKTGRRSCGGHHPKREPWMGMTVAKVAELAPSGDLVPLRYLRGDVLMVHRQGLELYENLTGSPASMVFNEHAETHTRQDALRRECEHPVPQQPRPGRYANYVFNPEKPRGVPAPCVICGVIVDLRHRGDPMHWICP